jgi:GR25 family glycosyltransferase involved in LPS biosynthesis
MEINIFEIPLYYIAFKKNSDLEKHYKDHGFKNVSHFEAVNGRKMDIDKLLKDNIISIRSYDDLRADRTEHSGIPTLGAIGCSLSHYKLWKLCLERGYPYIIIVEEDNRMCGKLSEQNINSIRNIISKPKGIFLSVKPKHKYNMKKHFFGTHFYIISKDACEELVKDFFPIDVQVDWYISNKASTDRVNTEGFKISKQTNGKSTIQALCISCLIPKGNKFYIVAFALVVFILFCVYLYRRKWKTCQKTCSRS